MLIANMFFFFFFLHEWSKCHQWKTQNGLVNPAMWF